MAKHPDQKTVPVSESEEMMADYVREKYVNVKVVRQPNHNVGVVTKFWGFKDVSYKDETTGQDKTIKKPLYEVEIQAHGYEFTLSQAQAKQIFDELGTKNPEALIGKKLKFSIDTAGKKEYVSATLIP